MLEPRQPIVEPEVEVRSIVSGTHVRHLGWNDPETRADIAQPAPPGIELGAEMPRLIEDAVVDAGACETSLRFQHAGDLAVQAGRAVLEVNLLSVTLATGEGPDPLTALWVHFRTHLSLPEGHGEPSAVRSWLGPAHAVAVDPKPRPLSEWVAGGGARVRDAVAALSRQLAPQMIADLRGGAPPAARCGGRGGDAGDVGARATPEVTAASARPPPGDAAPDVRVEFLAPTVTTGGGRRVLGVLGGGLAGVVLGAGWGLGECGRAIHGNDAVGAVAFGACAVVAMPVGILVGIAKGVETGASWAGRHESARSAERQRMARAAEGAAPSLAAAAVATAREAPAEGKTAGTARPVIGTMLVRLLEDASVPPLAQLELELSFGPGGEQGGAARRVCLRGPGPVPTELWLADDAGLLRASVEGQVARGMDLVLAGLEPPPGEGGCPVRAQMTREAGPRRAVSGTAAPAAE